MVIRYYVLLLLCYHYLVNKDLHQQSAYALHDYGISLPLIYAQFYDIEFIQLPLTCFTAVTYADMQSVACCSQSQWFAKIRLVFKDRERFVL